MHYTYILLSRKDGRFYVGSTGDLKRRFKEHVGGKVESTRHRNPLALIVYEAYLTKTEAERREKFLKTSDGKKDLRKRLIESLDQYGVVAE
jgi:putative endonuclease